MLVTFCVALGALGLALGAPIFPDYAVGNISEIEGDPLLINAGASDWAISFPDILNTSVPCSFCTPALGALLDVCKATDGKSLDALPYFLQLCHDVDGKRKPEDSTTPTSTYQYGKPVSRLYQKRMFCRRIYEAMLNIYRPYDPCNQLKVVVQRGGGAVCNSPELQCVPDPFKGYPPGPPPWKGGPLYYEPIPYSCPRYVKDIAVACRDVKRLNYYNRTDYDTFCTDTYSGTYQAEACGRIVDHFREQGGEMDMCSTLEIFPPVDDTVYCNKTLQIEDGPMVSATGFSAYVKEMKLRQKYQSTPFQAALKANITYRFPLPFPAFETGSFTGSN